MEWDRGKILTGHDRWMNPSSLFLMNLGAVEPLHSISSPVLVWVCLWFVPSHRESVDFGQLRGQRSCIMQQSAV
jgi:hypothetical protein